MSVCVSYLLQFGWERNDYDLLAAGRYTHAHTRTHTDMHGHTRTDSDICDTMLGVGQKL